MQGISAAAHAPQAAAGSAGRAPPMGAGSLARAVDVAAHAEAVAAPVTALVAGVATNYSDFSSHMKSKIFRDKHRLLTKKTHCESIGCVAGLTALWAI